MARPPASRVLGRVLGAAVLVFAALPAAPGAAEGPALWRDGRGVPLERGLSRTADKATWIARADLEGALGHPVKRLIPRPLQGRRPQQWREREDWIVCGPRGCGTVRGRTLGAENDPDFDLAEVARLLGYRLRERPDGLHLDTIAPRRRGAWPGPARLGQRVPDLALPFLDGERRSLAAQRGRRLLIVTWSTWSATRESLEAWQSLWDLKAGGALDLWFVALDVEGAARVAAYAPPGLRTPVAVDRDADLARRLAVHDAGHWFLLDELGILRAEREGFAEADVEWIVEHLAEPLAVPPAPAPRPPPASVDVLRARIAAQPDDVAARLALLAALEDGSPREALDQARALVEQRPRSVPFAFRLARMHLDQGDAAGALSVLDAARRRMPGAWLLRFQYWALEAPERFYGGAIDEAWILQRRREEARTLDPRGAR